MFTLKASELRPNTLPKPPKPRKAPRPDQGGGFQATAKLLLILLAIPALAFAVSYYYETKIDQEIHASLVQQYPDAPADKVAEFTMENLIFHPEKYGQVDFEADVYVFLFLKFGALACAGVSLLLVALVIVLGLVCRGSRDLLVALFPPAVGVSTVAIALLTVVNGLLLVGAIYYGESALIGRVHTVVVGIVGFGALLGSVAVLGSLRKAFRPNPLEVPEDELAEDHPLWGLVREVAEATGARVPDVVLLGKAPTFFVYEGAFTTAQYRQKGRLMYLSKDLSELLTADEVKAIVAHEFGHFIGGDLAYTRQFHFGYRALGGAMAQLAAAGDWFMIVGRLPSLYLFQFILNNFGTLERRFSRERELSADGLAVGLCGAQTFAEALTKVVLLVPVVEKAHEAAGSEGDYQVAFQEALAAAGEEDREALASVSQSHPFDTHPTLAERITHAGLDPEETIRGVRLERP